MSSAGPCSSLLSASSGLNVLTNRRPGCPLLWVPNSPLTNWPEASVISSCCDPAGLEKLTPPVCVAESKNALNEPSLFVGSSSNAIVPGP